MRAPRPPGTAINSQRRRKWIGNFATYRHQVSEQTIVDWLDQFAAEDRDAAARILDVVDFYSVDRISAAFKFTLAALPGWHRHAERRSGNWRFAGLSRSAGESADAMMHRFRVANGLDGKSFSELFIHPSQILLQGLGPDDALVLIDDFVGTGDSVSTAWKESFSELVAGIGRVYLVVVVALAAGLERVTNETTITCVAGHELTAGDNFFADQCDGFGKNEKQAILEYCQIASRKQPKGYRDCGLILTFQHRCPNNSLPILSADHRHWTGLFPRHG